MTTFVLVHGMWHGGWCWRKVSPLLRAAGHEVFSPTLTGLGERVHLYDDDIDLNTHIRDIVNVFEFEDIRQAVLVGHSFGGTMVPTLAAHVSERVAHFINLDGPIALDGQPLKDLIGDIWQYFLENAIDPDDPLRIRPIPDWTFGVKDTDLEWIRSKLTPHPLKALMTPIMVNHPAVEAIPHTYISCVEDASAGEIAAEATRYAGLGWGYRSLPTGHDAMITMPEALAAALLEIVEQVHDHRAP